MARRKNVAGQNGVCSNCARLQEENTRLRGLCDTLAKMLAGCTTDRVELLRQIHELEDKAKRPKRQPIREEVIRLHFEEDCSYQQIVQTLKDNRAYAPYMMELDNPLSTVAKICARHAEVLKGAVETQACFLKIGNQTAVGKRLLANFQRTGLISQQLLDDMLVKLRKTRAGNRILEDLRRHGIVD